MMKKLFMSLAAALMLGVATPTMAQQKKAPAKHTTTASVPIKPHNHMEFLGLEMGGDVTQFVRALRQKGFTDGNGFSDDPSMTFLRGNVYGMMSEISIIAEGNRVKTVTVSNMVYTKATATNRVNRFKKEMIALYGGKWVTANGMPTLKLPYGKVTYSSGMFDSGDYELGFYINDEGKTIPASGSTATVSDTKENTIVQNATVTSVDTLLKDLSFINELLLLNDFNKIRAKLIDAGWNPTEIEKDYVGQTYMGLKYEAKSEKGNIVVSEMKNSDHHFTINYTCEDLNLEIVKAQMPKIDFFFEKENHEPGTMTNDNYYFRNEKGFSALYKEMKYKEHLMTCLLFMNS